MNVARSAWRLPILAFGVLMGLLYGIIATAQVLGLLGLYRAWLAIPLSLLLSGLVTWLYLRQGGGEFLEATLGQGERRERWVITPGLALDGILLVCALALVFFLIVLPIGGFPYTPVSESLHWDVGTYHYPKALEMVSTGSAWDISLAYGDYPFGSESLTAFAALLTRDGSLFGAAHLLTCLALFFTFWFLLRRTTGLPQGLTAFLTALVLVSGYFYGQVLNIWWIFRYLNETIGKNDLFLGAGLLAVIVHAPIGSRENRARCYLLGMALASMLVLSTKPNGAPVVAALWLWAGLKMWKDASPSLKLKELPWRKFMVPALVMLPGVLWMVRNLIEEHALILSGADQLEAWSISANLLNPVFYQAVPRTLTAVLLITLVSAVLVRFVRSVDWTMVLASVILIAGFVITPASGFNAPDSPPDVQWRFAVAVLVFAFLLPVAWLAPLGRRVWAWVTSRKAPVGLLALALVGFSAWFINYNAKFFAFNPQNAIVLQDEYRESVGVNGYFSAFDFIHRNVRNSVVWVENGMSYYAYGPGFTNSISRKTPADYLVVFYTNFLWGPDGWPSFVNDPQWQKGWTMVYEDKGGRVYQRLK